MAFRSLIASFALHVNTGAFGSSGPVIGLRKPIFTVVFSSSSSSPPRHPAKAAASMLSVIIVAINFIVLIAYPRS